MLDAPPAPLDSARLAALRDWLIDGARPNVRASDFITRLCEGLREAGVPLDRFGMFILTLHPNMKGCAFLWRPQAGIAVREADYKVAATPEFRDSIAVHVIETGRTYRCRFADGDDLPPFPDVVDIRDEGMTDYLIEPLVYTTGETHAVSWATRAPGGFTDAQVAAIEAVRAPLARLAEIYMLRLNAASLLSAYVGRGGGRRVLEGNVRRGDTERIAAAVLFVDINDFTTMAVSMPASAVVDMLNGFFDVLVEAIEDRGGEVLKFIGDALLAIFPVGPGSRAGAGGEAQAVTAAVAALVRAGELFAWEPEKRVPWRASIHVGEVSYGNIGGGDRLDFTAIGPAVNLAARLLLVASQTGRDVVCSDVAARHVAGAELLGAFQLKGLAAPQPVHAVPLPRPAVAGQAAASPATPDGAG